MKVKPLLSKVNSSTLLRDYLNACGIKDVEGYLKPDDSAFDSPWLYANMQEAVDRLYNAISCDEKIGILQDVDGDGVMSTVIAYDFLCKQGNNPIVFWHTGKQHGLRTSKEENIVKQVKESGITLLWIPDAGSGDVEQCKELKESGVDVVITDHHLAVNNPYAIVVNCHFGENINTNLTGAGVTDKLIAGYCEKYGIERPDYSDLVAFSLVSDIADFTSIENRAYMITAQEQHNDFLQYMSNKLGRGEEYTPHNISWNLSPKINAVQRSDDMEAKKQLFYGFVGETDKDEAIKIANKLHKEQAERVKKIYQSLQEQIDLSKKVIVVFGEVEDANYLGLAANKIMGQYGKPVIVLREADSTMWCGSVRSPFPLIEQVNSSGLAKGQGHSSAFGIFLKKSNLNRFMAWIDKLDVDTNPDIPVTASIKPKQITLPLCHAIVDNVMLWAKGVDMPVFHVCGRVNKADIQVFQKKTTTVKIMIDGIAFLLFMAKEEDVEKLMEHDVFDIDMVAKLDVNEWNGVESPQGRIESWEIRAIEDKQEDWKDLF